MIGNDGWESVATDIIGIHDYDPQPEHIASRYDTMAALPNLLKHERPGGRVLALGPGPGTEHPVVLSEFGGIALAPTAESWGYSRVRDADELQRRYAALLKTVSALRMLSGFCYTQFADTYQEANGLLFDDRTPKFPLELIAAATQGAETERPTPLDEPKTQRREAPG